MEEQLTTIGSPTWTEIRDAHIDRVTVIDGKAKNTGGNYRGAYNTFNRFVQARDGREAVPSDFNYETLEAYLAQCSVEQKKNSYNVRLSCMKTISKWLMRRGYLPYGPDPMEEFTPKKLPKGSPRGRRLSDEEFLKLLSATRERGGHLRDYFLVLFIRLSGRRIGEARALRWVDIRWDLGFYTYANSKGHKNHQKEPLTQDLMDMLKAWAEIFEKEVGYEIRPSWKVFPATTGVGSSHSGPRQRKLSPEFTMGESSATELMDKLLDRSGLRLSEGDGWHIIRKSFADELNENGRKGGEAKHLDMTSRALGHEDVKTTRIYVDEDKDYEAYAAHRARTPVISPAVRAAIPYLTTPPPAADPVNEEKAAPEGGDNVIDMRERFAKRA